MKLTPVPRLTVEQAQDMVKRYRKRHPNIAKFWNEKGKRNET